MIAGLAENIRKNVVPSLIIPVDGINIGVLGIVTKTANE